jgi:XRE family transcriptional regulator, aerobic/anaerobic benzoate catabolism transcriptional regulator
MTYPWREPLGTRREARAKPESGPVRQVAWRRCGERSNGGHLNDSIPYAEPAPDWPVIRDLVRKATPNQIAHARQNFIRTTQRQRRRSGRWRSPASP